MTAVTSPNDSPRMTPGRAGNVLVIEDHDRQSVDLLGKLSRLSIEATRARTGPEAIRMAMIDRPSVIFVDGLLPGMHGLEVARFIRSIDSAYRPYIVMTTGIYKNVKYRNEAILKYGVDEYLVKPVPEDALLTVLAAAGITAEAPRAEAS